MEKENRFMKNARLRNLIDDQEIAFMTDIVCTDGNNGRAWILLNGSLLNLCEPIGLADLGELIETLDLEKAEFIKASSFIFNPYFKLKYNGQIYTFKHFAQAKRVIEVIEKTCGA